MADNVKDADIIDIQIADFKLELDLKQTINELCVTLEPKQALSANMILTGFNERLGNIMSAISKLETKLDNK